MRAAALGAFCLCAALTWLAQFHHLRDFGLYEDDYFFIAEAMGKSPDYLAARLHIAVTTLPQGRPLGFFLPDLLSFVGDKIGGLTAIYVLGWLIVSLNTYLVYRLLRARVPVAPSIVGAAVFCLFPSDTTKILLTHDFQLQPALTFALLAALAYATGRTWLTYVLGAGALLSYESGYLALFGLPLLARAWDRRLPRALVLNAAGLLAVMVLAVAARFVAGEGRATSSAGTVGSILPPLLGSLVLGPARSLAGMFYGPVKSIPTWDGETLVCAVIALVAFAALLAYAAGLFRRGDPLRLGPQHSARSQEPRHEPSFEPSQEPSFEPSHRVSERWGTRPAPIGAALKTAAAGLVMLVLGYGLAFTHFPPNALVGRGTSVHLGATIGMAVLAAGLAWFLLQTRKRLAVAAISAYLALAVAYYVTIERDFVRAWQTQRAFWQDVVACCSDLQDGTVLIYELNPVDESQFIFNNSWADPLVLDETFAFPSAWSTPPRLFSLTTWQDRVQVDGDHLMWWVPGASWDEHWEVLPQQNVILLRRGADGDLQRISGLITITPGVTGSVTPSVTPGVTATVTPGVTAVTPQTVTPGVTQLELKSPGPPRIWPAAQLADPLLR